MKEQEFPALEASEITKTFHHPHPLPLLQNVSLKVEKGKSIAIIGASGEGKTTLLHILGGLEKADSGQIKLSGTLIKNENAAHFRNQKMGFIFQSYNLIHDLTLLENLLLPCKMQRLSTAKNSSSYQRALFLLQQVGLNEKAHIPAKVLSGGEKQRGAIARSLINDPDILFADEPSGNLDSCNSELIHNLLFTFVKNFKKSLILVTHDLELAGKCDEIFLLKKGSLKKQ